MPKPIDMFANVAILMNDSAQTQYTNTVILPFFNMAQRILQEIYELNGLPVTNKTTASPITIKSAPAASATTPGIVKLGFDTIPRLPGDLVEIQQIWESTAGLFQWTPMDKKDFIPHYLENLTQTSVFLIWAWENDHIILIAADADIDLKIDYTSSLFLPITTATQEVNLNFTNIQTYLEFETTALCALFVAENPTRAQALDSEAGQALYRALGIPLKGMQSILVRRRPFRHSFKHRGINY